MNKDIKEKKKNKTEKRALGKICQVRLLATYFYCEQQLSWAVKDENQQPRLTEGEEVWRRQTEVWRLWRGGIVWCGKLV